MIELVRPSWALGGRAGQLIWLSRFGFFSGPMQSGGFFVSLQGAHLTL
jgi:hypothetical protein